MSAHVFLARQTRGELWDPSLFWIATVETTGRAEMFDRVAVFLQSCVPVWQPRTTLWKG